MAIFDEYLFADYSGAGEDRSAQRCIALWTSFTNSDAHKLYPVSERTKNFSRESLLEFVSQRLRQATQQKRRVVFGFDHQYAWPVRLRRHAGIERLEWRVAVRKLIEGDLSTGLPPLDIPKRYCQRFNSFSSADSFWTPLTNKARLYGIPNRRPDASDHERFRLTELVRPFHGRSSPKPADTVGGTGEGIVGGQTICGLRQLGKLLDRTDIAWWPFDGLDIEADAYKGKHVGTEIYPSAFRKGNQQSDDHDAEATCLAVRDADRSGYLLTLMQLKIPSKFHRQVKLEGWIVGMDPGSINRLGPLGDG